MEHIEQRDNTKKYLIGIIIILLLVNGFFIYNYVNTDKQLEQTTENLVDVEKEKLELDGLLKESQEMLNNYKGKNAELDVIIQQKNEEIQVKAKEIEDMLRKGKITSRELEKARDELDRLRYYVKKYSGQIDSLSKQNQYLLEKNREMSASLDGQKKDNESLAMKNISLENKMSLAKKLNIRQISSTGIIKRSSGRETETTRAGRLDIFRVSFSLDQNFVSDKGEKEFFVRITAPDGKTIASSGDGGGTFPYNGEDLFYTVRRVFEFTNEGQVYVVNYDRGADWSKGEYKIDVYCEGYLIGSQSLKLR